MVDLKTTAQEVGLVVVVPVALFTSVKLALEVLALNVALDLLEGSRGGA